MFSSALSKDAYEFLIACEDKLHNLGQVEICGVYYTAF